MSRIYWSNGRYYEMLKPVGSLQLKGYTHYALWKPVIKFLWFYIRDGKREDFWLDMYGFINIKDLKDKGVL